MIMLQMLYKSIFGLLLGIIFGALLGGTAGSAFAGLQFAVSGMILGAMTGAVLGSTAGFLHSINARERLAQRQVVSSGQPGWVHIPASGD